MLKLPALRAAEWRWLLAALVLLPATGLALRVVGYRRTRGMLARCFVCHPSAGIPPFQSIGRGAECPVALDVARMVSLAARRGPYRAPCLPEALVAWALLHRIGAPADLRIGVNLQRSRFSAHAWVELGDKVLVGGSGFPGDYETMI